MTEDRNELQAKLDDIDARIKGIRHRIKLQDIFDRGHSATKAELQERHKILAQQLRDEVTDLEAHGHHVSALEQLVLNWANKLRF